MHVNWPAWADDNQLKWEKVRFFLEMNEISSRWIIFSIYACVYVVFYIPETELFNIHENL